MNTIPRWEYLMSSLKIAPLPVEGGYFKETYRSDECVSRKHLPSRYSGHRAFQTSILFLLVHNDVSKIHRLKSDEVWHFHEGSSVIIHEFTSNGEYRTHTLGRDIANGEAFQVAIPHGSWFGACLTDPTSYGLVGCTMGPGFEFEDFEIGNREELIKQFPEQKLVIEQLT